jgi:hypothetical protein
LGHHFLKDPKHAQQEAHALLEYKFPLVQFKRHDPKGLVYNNYDIIYLAWTYTHECLEYEMPFENAKYWDEV